VRQRRSRLTLPNKHAAAYNMKIIFLISVLIVVSCSGGNSESPGEALKAYCIRECVLETAAAEICDARCVCAVDRVEASTSAEGLRELQRIVTQPNNPGPGGGGELFKEALESCAQVIK
jgi:hypothetical protein